MRSRDPGERAAARPDFGAPQRAGLGLVFFLYFSRDFSSFNIYVIKILSREVFSYHKGWRIAGTHPPSAGAGSRKWEREVFLRITVEVSEKV